MKKLLIAFLMLLLFPVGAWAYSFTTDLMFSNVSLGISGPFGTVSVATGDDITTTLSSYGISTGPTSDLTNTALFIVSADETLLVPDDNFGIDKFYFNYDNSISSPLSSLSYSDISLPSGWSVDTTTNPDAFKEDNVSSFGLFYVGTTADTGQDRLNPLVFWVNNPGIDDTGTDQFFVANADGSHYAAHVAGFTTLNGYTSAFFSDGPPAPVPEPATLLLVGTGLVGLAGFSRKKFKKS